MENPWKVATIALGVFMPLVIGLVYISKKSELVSQNNASSNLFDSNWACQLLKNEGLDQGNYAFAGNPGIPNRYSCKDYKVKELTCTSSVDTFKVKGNCNIIEYKSLGTKKGVTDLNLVYYGNDDDVGHKEDIKLFLKIGNELTRNALNIELSEEAKKAIIETLSLNYRKGQHEVFKNNFGPTILSIQRSILPYENSKNKAKRRIHLIIYANEYWTNNDNVLSAWKEK
ncbi:MAG: hypothetical protein M3388_16405 [Acidobacteriota bacterium]|nr:hypothetical protein [Acidobacteriota bacterium]